MPPAHRVSSKSFPRRDQKNGHGNEKDRIDSEDLESTMRSLSSLMNDSDNVLPSRQDNSGEDRRVAASTICSILYSQVQP